MHCLRFSTTKHAPPKVDNERYPAHAPDSGDALHARLLELITREKLIEDIRASLQAYTPASPSDFTQKWLEALSRGCQDEDQGRPSDVTFTVDRLRMGVTSMRFLTAIADAYEYRNEGHYMGTLDEVRAREPESLDPDFWDQELLRAKMEPLLSEFHARQVQRSSSSGQSGPDQAAEPECLPDTVV